MKIVAVELVGELGIKFTFERNGHRVCKGMRIDHRAEDFIATFQLRAREADRDLAYKDHGAAFREHCEFKSNFWTGGLA